LSAVWTFVLTAQSFGDVLKWAPSSPVGIGKPHACGQEYYPLSAIKSFSSGTTVVAFVIDTNGVPQNVTVDRTSGNADLDAAAVECASTWRYSPARQDGKPVSLSWKAQVVWKMPTVYVPVEFNPAAHRCPVMFERKPRGPEEADLVFWIDQSGHVTEPRIATSSGDPDLDADLVKCVSGWTYGPAKIDYQPVGVTWGVGFRWSSDGSLGFGEGLPHAHWCVTRFQRPAPDGRTVLKFKITQSGSVDGIEIAESSGNSDFDDEAKECARSWRYRHLDTNPPESTDWSAQVYWSYWLGSIAELGKGDVVPDGTR
jgi:TonB family protein